MKSIIHLNYSSDIEDITTNISSVQSLYHNEPLFLKLQPTETVKKSVLLKAKNALIKLKPSNWFNDVWDDLDIKM